jgi:DNA-binding response OmpR family regulator
VHGDTICRRIAADELPVMVLMLTAAGTPGERVAGLSLGADDYLAKPFHFPELILRIHALARRKPEMRSRVLRFADVELDPAKRTVTRAGTALDLTPKEFAVLEVLLRAEPGVVSAEELLERAWDEHADPFTRTVSVTISRLRRRLGDPPVIETVAGLGYHLVR